MPRTRNLEERVTRFFKHAFHGHNVDFLNLCKKTALKLQARTEVLTDGGNLLNQRQCIDLTSKLSKTTLNIEELLSQCTEWGPFRFRVALENLYRYLEKAKLLVESCGEKNWLAASIFQSQNENAFREILLDVSFCYNAIYEQVKSMSKDGNVLPEDLRLHPNVFLSITNNDIQQDQQDLLKRLEDLANEPDSIKLLDHPLPVEVAQCLARYLLVKMLYSSNQLQQATILDAFSPLLWRKEIEPPGTWGKKDNLGVGANVGGVWSTEWLGIRCAKKEFHLKEYEGLFLKEASIMAYLKHPCIINFICCGNGQGRGDRFIAMELMEKSLFDLIEDQKDNKFSLPMVFDIIVQIARGMYYLHGQGVAHRDLKPQNVVVNKLTYSHIEDHFCVKLVDFGTSKMKVEVSNSNTISHRGVGTKMYRAPEVHPNANYSRKGRANWFKADVFSFAMTCAHVLSLKPPFQDMKVASTIEQLYDALMNGVRPKLPNNYPEELVTLIRDCWNTIPRRRPSFMNICGRLEILRYKILRGFSPNQHLDLKKVEFQTSLSFIEAKMEEQSSSKGLFAINTNEEVEGEDNKIDVVSVIPCSCGRALELLPQPRQNDYGLPLCDMCWEEVDGKDYCCRTCIFDTHPDCVEIGDTVNVYFHHHPLHLLVQNYYNDDPDAICRLCEESIQHSEWVYRCEKCDFDAHALCTKYPKGRINARIHPHLLTLIQCHSRKTILCTCCNSEIKGHSWHYKCTLNSCAFDLHPLCTILSWDPFCIFDGSHRLCLVNHEKNFQCGRCGKLGFSWFYHCKQCSVDIHIDCMDDMEEETEDWNGAYEKFIIEYEKKDEHTKMNMITNFLDKMLVTNTLEASSSSSSTPLPVMTRLQPLFSRLALMERPNLDTFIEEDLRKTIATESTVRKAKKVVVVKETRQKLKKKSLEILENSKKLVLDLQSSKNLSQADKEVLTSTLKKLKERLCILIQEVNSTQMQWKMCQPGPRIVLFYKWEKYSKPKQLLTSLQANMEAVSFDCLCEEPGHEHIVDVALGRKFNGPLGEMVCQKLRPLLGSGLEVVTRAMSTLACEFSTLKSIRLPLISQKWTWDLQTIALENHAKKNKNPFENKENREASVKMAEDSAAEWFLSSLDDTRCDIFNSFGLRRVRYTRNDEGNFPRYTRGSLAWLCLDHLIHGLEAGTLESFPSKFYNPEYDIIRDN